MADHINYVVICLRPHFRFPNFVVFDYSLILSLRQWGYIIITPMGFILSLRPWVYIITTPMGLYYQYAHGVILSVRPWCYIISMPMVLYCQYAHGVIFGWGYNTVCHVYNPIKSETKLFSNIFNFCEFCALHKI